MAFSSSLPDLVYTDELKREFPSIFVYAISGAGKTNLLRTLRHLRPLVIATEDGQTKGMGTLADLHLPAILVENVDQVLAIVAELLAHAKRGELWYRGAGPFGVCAVDSFTGIGPMLEDASKEVRGWDMIWSPERGKDPRNAYPYIAERGRQIMRRFLDLPVPLVVTCREQIMTEGEGKEQRTWFVPELPGQKLPRELPGWMEASVRLRVLNNRRVLITENEGDTIARVRLGEGIRCPKYIRPDLGALLRLLQGDTSELNDIGVNFNEQQASTAPTAPKTPQQLAAEARRVASVNVKA